MATPKTEPFNLLEVAQIEAMDEVLAWINAEAKEPVRPISWEYFLRRIYRWYCKEWGGDPYVVMQTVPVDFVLQAFYETKYENMEDPERLEEAAILAETPEERAVRLAEEKTAQEEDDEFLRSVQEEAARTVQKALNTGKDLATQLMTMGDVLSKAVIPSMQNLPEEEPPDIKLEVVSDEEIRQMEEANWALFQSENGQSSRK